MNRYFSRHAILLVTLLSVLSCYSLIAQQRDSAYIIVTKKPEASKYVAAATIDAVRYVSLPDFIRSLGLNYFYNSVTKKMEIKLMKAQMKVAGGNSFVVTTVQRMAIRKTTAPT